MPRYILYLRQDGAPVVAPAAKDWKISIKDPTDNTIESIPVIAPYTPYRSLGTTQCHSKDQLEQFQTQLKKSKQLTTELICSGISSQCAWVHYTAIFIPSITYPFQVCHMNVTKLHNLQKRYIPALLNKLHFSATYSHAMFFGSRSYGGIDGKDCHTKQGFSVIHDCMRTLGTPGNGQSNLKLFLRTFQHASGFSQPLFLNPTKRAPHLEGHLYVYLRSFLAKHHSTLEIACIQERMMERDNDFYLMDWICCKSKEQLNDTNLRRFNYCRLFLQVHRLSDICIPD